MADEKKSPEKEEKVSVKKDAPQKPKKPKKNIGAAIKKWFKDMRGENKKIVWPTRKMVIKSTGVVIAAILVIGIGIWILDFLMSGAVGAVNKAAQNRTETTTEAVADTDEQEAEVAEEPDETEDTTEDTTEKAEKEADAEEESTTEATTAAAAD